MFFVMAMRKIVAKRMKFVSFERDGIKNDEKVDTCIAAVYFGFGMHGMSEGSSNSGRYSQ